LDEFADRVEPVEALSVTCTLDGDQIDGGSDRPYFVAPPAKDEILTAFVVWEGEQGWPPPAEGAQALALALADLLGLNLVETFLAFIQSSPHQRLRLLEIAGGRGLLEEVRGEMEGTSQVSPSRDPVAPEPTPNPDTADREDAPQPPSGREPAAAPVPLLTFEQLTIDGEPFIVSGEQRPGSHKERADEGDAGGERNEENRRSAPGVDLNALDALGMRIATAYEVRRLRSAGFSRATSGLDAESDSIVIDVSTPAAIQAAEQASATARNALLRLEELGVSRLYPGFDILSIAGGATNRLIELKSSAVNARTQAMTWNEWKSARASELRGEFWLYLVGNLRADLDGAPPFVRAIHDPFASLVADEVEQRQVRRAVHLNVREFAEAEHLDLMVASA